MQFLAPLFLAALVALAVPVVLHIRRRRPRDRVSFSAVRFLDPSAPVQRRHLRLQDILLLLLRCLAIALIVFAFTRPFFGNESAAAPAGGGRIVILIDTSASMRGERIDDAKRAAESIVANSDPGSRIAIAAFDDGFRPILPFDDSASARAAIRSIEAGWRATNLAAALAGALDLVEQDREASGDSEAVIHVVSDLQQTAVTDGLDELSWPPRVRVAPVIIGGDDWTNGGVQVVDSTESRSLRIANSTGSQGADFQLAWPAGPAQSLRIEPGTAIDLPIRAGAEIDRAGLRGDSFAFDNRAWIAPAADFSAPVDYLGTDSPGDSSGSLFFLSRALSASRNPAIDLRVNPPADSQPAALTIVDQPLSDAATQGVRARLEAGGNVLLVLRGTDMRATLAALAGTENLLEEISPARPALFGRIDFDDPVFAPFSDPRYSNFSPITTWRYRRIAAPADAKVLAAFSSGDPALLRISAGRGTLFVLATSWRPDDSQLALSSKFAPLLLAMLGESEDSRPPSTQALVGQPVRLPRGAAREIRAPGGRTLEAADGVFRGTDEPGLYRTVDDRFVFAVNPPPQETGLAPIPIASLRALGIPFDLGKTSAVSPESRPSAIRADLENRQKWWRWLILAAIVALVTETAAAAWSSRHQPLMP